MIARRIAVSLLVIAAAVLGYVLLSGGDDGYTVKAELANAGGLRKNSSVKINGVPAGKVLRLDITARDTAVATLRIDDSAAPLGEGVQLHVRPTDLLGERYAELKGGDPARPLPAGARIPLQRTGTPVELDDILNMLDADTRQRLGILINEVGVAFTKRGADFNRLLAQLPPSLQDTDKLLEQIGAENRAIKQGIERADRVTALVNSRREDMGDLIRTAGDALGTVAEKRAELGATIRNAPGALQQLRGTLASLDAASADLRPAAVDLRATAGPLRDTLAALPDFADEARPALAKAEAVSPALTRLGRQATPTVQKLERSVRNTATLLEGSAPILHQLDRRGWDDLLFFVNNFNLGLRGRDAIGHFIGAKLNIAAEYIDSAIENFTNVESKRRQSAARRTLPDAVRDVTGKTRDTGKKLQDALKGVTDTVKGVTDRATKQLDQTGKQVQDGVNNVLGGVNGPLGGQPGAGSDSDALRLFDYLMGQ